MSVATETSQSKAPDEPAPGAQRAQCDYSGQDLRERDFSNQFLINATFRNADLRGAVFTRANIQASFAGANLEGAKLDAESLQNCDFTGANCKGVDFGDANLREARWQNTDLKDANLARAVGIRKKLLDQAITDESTRLPQVFHDVSAELELWERRARKGILVGPQAEMIYREETGHPLPQANQE